MDRQKVLEIIGELENGISKKEYLTCECFHGLLTQLELDSSEDIFDLVTKYKVPNEKMHGCMGCQPCPSSELFADYLRGK